MTTIVTRAGKGSPLTNTEVDTNFTNLNTAKIETLTSTDSSVTITGTGSSRDLSVPVNPNVVSGPASATDNAVARFDGTTGKLIQNSTAATIDDSGNADFLSQKADFFDIDTAATTSAAVGRIRWDVTKGTALLGEIGGNLEAAIGQTLDAYVTNAEAVTITKGQAVYLFSAQGDRASVKLAYNTGDATSAKTLGIVAESIPANGTGLIRCQGVLDGLNLGSYTAGDTLYLGATAGALTATKPAAPNHLVYIGVVERANSGNGLLYIRVQNGYELNEIHDVSVPSPTDGQPLVYEASTDLWKNKTLPIIGGGTGATSAPYAMANLMGFTSTATAAGTTTLTNTSSYYQLFTGSTTQTIVLPVTSTLQTGWTFHICNNSTGDLTVYSSGGNSVITVIAGTTVMVTCIGTTLTTAADWEAGYTDFSTATGSGSVVLSSNPTFSSVTATGIINLSGSTSASISIGTSQTTGSITFGSTTGSGTYNFGRTTATQTTNIQAGATASGSTKTINLGTGGLAGSTTNIAIGSTTGTSTTNLQGVLQINSSAGTAGQVLTSSGAGVAATWASAAGATITDDTTTNATRYPLFDDATSGSLTSVNVSSTKYTFNPSTGTLSATVMTASSDERLKENWTNVAHDFVEKLANVKHGVFTRIDSGNREAGVTAQSLQTVLPESVVAGADGYLSVNYGGAALVAAIELAKVVEELRAEIAMLKAKVGE